MLTDVMTCKAEYEELLEISGKQLRDLRRQSHLTMQALADICHLTRQTIFALENDHKDQPSAFRVQDSTKLLVAITLRRLASCRQLPRTNEDR